MSIQSETINLSTQMPNKIEISEPKSKLVVGMNSAVKIFDLNRPTQGPERVFDSSHFKGNVTSVGFRTHDRIMYTSYEDGCIRIFDLRDKKKAK
jgi:WD40 repeat protein